MPTDAERTNAFVAGVKSINSTAALAQYLNFPDVRGNPASTDYAYALAVEATARGWWLERPTAAR